MTIHTLRNIMSHMGRRRLVTGDRRAFVDGLPKRVEAEEDNQATERASLQSEKLAAVGLLAAAAMHEINNPVSAILAYAQFLLKGELKDGQRADVERIAAEALRASRIVRSLLTLARPARPRKALLDINTAVQSVLNPRTRQLAADHIAVHTALAADLPPVEADAGQLEQVFVNIINNARDAMRTGGHCRRLTVCTAVRCGRVQVVFEDTGPGIPEDCLDRIFDPFFTTKEDNGTGLGLAVCRGIMREHGGAISARNLPGGGARVTVELPEAPEAAHDG